MQTRLFEAEQGADLVRQGAGGIEKTHRVIKFRTTGAFFMIIAIAIFAALRHLKCERSG